MAKAMLDWMIIAMSFIEVFNHVGRGGAIDRDNRDVIGQLYALNC